MAASMCSAVSLRCPTSQPRRCGVVCRAGADTSWVGPQSPHLRTGTMMPRHTQRPAHPTCTAAVHQRPHGRPPMTEDRTARGPGHTLHTWP